MQPTSTSYPRADGRRIVSVEVDIMANAVGITRVTVVRKMTEEQVDAVIVGASDGGLETVPGWWQRSCGGNNVA